MSFISKVELKKQLQEMGFKVEGNYVRKKNIEQVLAEKVTTLTVFRGVKDIWAKNLPEERKSEGFWGIGTYYALDLPTAEDYIKYGASASGDMKEWGFVGEFTFTGVIKKLTPEQPSDTEWEKGFVDLPKKYPKSTVFMLIQGDNYNPPEGGEQLLITPKSKYKAILKRFWVYFVKDKNAKYFASVFKKANEDKKVGPFSVGEIKEVDTMLQNIKNLTK